MFALKYVNSVLLLYDSYSQSYINVFHNDMISGNVSHDCFCFCRPVKDESCAMIPLSLKRVHAERQRLNIYSIEKSHLQHRYYIGNSTGVWAPLWGQCDERSITVK